MLEVLDNLLKKLVGLYNNTESSPRKRRLSRDPDNFQCKMRRLDDFVMPRSSSPIEDYDTPSSSKGIFKRPTFPSSRSFLRSTDVIDLSDDEDCEVKSKYEPLFGATKDGWVDARKAKNEFFTKSNYLARQARIRNDASRKHYSVLRKAKNTLTNCNNFITTARKPINNSVLNESIRISEKQRYKQILDSLAKETRIFSFKDFNGTERKVHDDEKTTEKNTTQFKSVSEFYGKKLEDLNVKTIDLSADLEKPKTISLDSDSDSDVKIVAVKKLSPVNSLKKRLEIEPVMNQNWISEWSSQYSRTTEEKKKQIEEEKIRRDKFRDVNRANVQCRLEETLKSCLRLQEVVLLDEEPEIEEVLSLPELTEEQERTINQAMKPGPSHVLIEKFNLSITRNDLQTLKGLNWLNDEVINFYTNMIAERGNGSGKLPKVHSMNTFFYPKLISQGYNSLRRWTKKVDIFAQDIIVIPIHLGVHWCMSIIDFRDKTIKYYDSMGSENPKCLKSLLDYLAQEHLDKKKSGYDLSAWKTTSVRDIPQQMNGSDCGMFACMYAEFITRNSKILFTQEHMPYFRRKMVLEIVTGKLLMK